MGQRRQLHLVLAAGAVRPGITYGQLTAGQLAR